MRENGIRSRQLLRHNVEQKVRVTTERAAYTHARFKHSKGIAIPWALSIRHPKKPEIPGGK